MINNIKNRLKLDVEIIINYIDNQEKTIKYLQNTIKDLNNEFIFIPKNELISKTDDDIIAIFRKQAKQKSI